jgi:cytidylate kinase
MSRVLTLSATYGAGGSVVAPKLAERLQLTFYDRLTHGPDTRSAERIEERLTEEERSEAPPGRLAVSLSHLSGALGIPVPEAGDLDPNIELRQKVAASVWRVAETGGGLILGRGAAAVLGAHSSAFHLRLDGPVERRIAQGAVLEGVSEDVARAHQQDTDKAWARFVKRLFDRDPTDPRLYHLVIDSTAIPLGDVVETLVAASTAFWERGIGCG